MFNRNIKRYFSQILYNPPAWYPFEASKNECLFVFWGESTLSKWFTYFKIFDLSILSTSIPMSFFAVCVFGCHHLQLRGLAVPGEERRPLRTTHPSLSTPSPGCEGETVNTGPPSILWETVHCQCGSPAIVFLYTSPITDKCLPSLFCMNNRQRDEDNSHPASSSSNPPLR